MKKAVARVAERSRAARKPARLAAVASAAASWPDRLHAVLRDLGIHQVAYVPDSGHARLIELVARTSRCAPFR